MMRQTRERHFHVEMARVRELLLEMASDAEDMVRLSAEALREGSTEKAVRVIQMDDRLDQLEVEIDELCVHLLALHQPFARDLRFLAMAMKISNDLERVGDHAENIAEEVERVLGQRELTRVPEIEEMARQASEMLCNSLDAFVRNDAEAAREVLRQDDAVDALHSSMFRIALSHMMEDPRKIGSGMSLFTVSGNLERIADMATNIAEDVIYMVEGRNIKHHHFEVA